MKYGERLFVSHFSCGKWETISKLLAPGYRLIKIESEARTKSGALFSVCVNIGNIKLEFYGNDPCSTNMEVTCLERLEQWQFARELADAFCLAYRFLLLNLQMC